MPDTVTAVLAALGRVVLGAVLVLVALAAMLLAAYGPQGAWTLAWLGVTGVVVAACGLALERLGKRRQAVSGADGAYPEDWREQGWCCRDCAVAAWNGTSLELRHEFARRRDG